MKSVEDKYNKAISLLTRKKYDKALVLFRAAIKQHPCKEGWLNIGAIQKEYGNWDEAWKCFEKANSPEIPYWNGKKAEQDASALHNLGSMIYRKEENDELARRYYMDAWLVDKDTMSAPWNYGITGIRQHADGVEGIDLKKMWKYYEYRFHKDGIDLYTHMIHEQWDAQTPHLDEELVLLKDQGMGDTIMFSRYIEEVKKYFKKVYVQCEKPLECLYENIFTENDSPKYYFPICNLGQLLDYIPSGEWLASKRVNRSVKGNIGCVWSGGNQFENNKYRNCPPEFFDRLGGNKFTFGPNEQRKGYTHLNGVTWNDTIRNLAEMEIVVTVDTSMAHMCGSLGMPCLVLMPLQFSDFRWGSKKSGEHTIWYKSVRVIRNPGNWDAVINNVKEILNCYN